MERRKGRVPFFILIVSLVSADDLTLNVNFKKPITVTDEKFLSLTIDPVTLLTKDVLSANFEKSANMARGLAPAYVRFGGPSSNSYIFGRENNHQSDDNRKFILSESHWILMNQWAERAGLDVVACLTPGLGKDRDETHSEDSDDEMLNIVSFNDHMGYNTSWQIGYECQTRCNLSAIDLGRRVLNLRKLLDTYPRYYGSMIIGPDVIGYETKEEQEYLQDYLDVAGRAISAITWHPNLAGVTLDEEGVSLNYDDLAIGKENLYGVIGRLVETKPLWIAESKTEDCKDQFLGALVWTRRLGNAAKLRAEVLMKQPVDLANPTPDYWVSLLHKRLVGREVFDVKVQSGNNSRVYFYCQCTNPTARYDKGSVTLFGVNLTPNDQVVHLRALRTTTVHKYILLPGFDTPHRMFAKTVLMNGEPLGLANSTDIPDLRPEIVTDRRDQGLNLPAGGIGFWVLPDAKIKACMGTEENANERSFLRRSLKRTINLEVIGDEGEQRRERSGKPRSRGGRNRERHGSSERKTVRRIKRNDLHQELDIVKKILKEELEYQERSANDTLPETKNRTGAPEPAENIRSILYVLQVRNTSDERPEGSARGEIIPKGLLLVSETEDALQAMDTETSNGTGKIAASANMKDHLKLLYDLLDSMSPRVPGNAPLFEGEPAGDPGKRVERDLDRRREEPIPVRKDILHRVRARGEELRGRRNERREKILSGKKKEDVRREVQPSALPTRNTESGENNFYGFPRREPMEGFPKGDLHLVTGDSSTADDYDYVKDEDEESGQRGESRKSVQHHDGEDVWLEDENDYAPNEFFENVKMPSYPIRENLKDGVELTEAEEHGNAGETRINQDQTRGARFSNGENFEQFASYYEVPSSRQSFEDSTSLNVERRRRNARTGRKTLMASEAANGDLRFFLASHDESENKRLKRMNEDMDKILTQEMMNEDEDNAGDCRCRVIRSLRESPRICYCRVKRSTQPETIENAGTVSVARNRQETDRFNPTGSYVQENRPESSPEITSAHSSVTSPESLNPGTASSIVNPEMEIATQTPNENNSNAQMEKADAEREPETVPVEAHENEPAEIVADQETSVDFTRNVRESISKARKNTNAPSASASGEEASTPQPGEKFFRGSKSKIVEKTTTTDNRKGASGFYKSDRPVATTSMAEAPEPTKATATAENSAERTTQSGSGPATPAGLSEKELAEEPDGPESDDVYNTATNGPLKREADQSTAMPETTADPGTLVQSRRTSSRAGNAHRKRGRTNERTEEAEKARETRLQERKAASAARRENEKKVRRPQEPSSKPSTNEEAKNLRERIEQIRKLRDRLRTRREKMLQQYGTEMLDTLERAKDPDKKNPKRRETWGTMKGAGLHGPIDSENPAYILMYRPDEPSRRRRDRRQDAEPIEYSRGRSICESIRSPRHFVDPRIMRHSDPQGFGRKLIRLQDIDNDRVTAKRVKYTDDSRGNGKTYYAIVEDLREPMILQEEKVERKRSAQATGRRSYNRPQFKRYCDNYKYQGTNDADDDTEEDSDEVRLGKRVYMIDPSTYRGGEPILQLHEDSRELKHSNAKFRPRVPQLKRQSDDTSEDFIPFEKIPKLNLPGRQNNKRLYIYNMPAYKAGKSNSGRFLKILNPAPRSELAGGEDITRAGTDRKDTTDKTSTEGAIRDDTTEKATAAEEIVQQEPVDRESEAETRAVPAVASPATEDSIVDGAKPDINSKTPVAVPETKDLESGEKSNSRGKRATVVRESKPRLYRAPVSLFRNKRSRKGGNYLCLKEVSGESSEEDTAPGRLFQITKRDDHYVAEPVKNSGMVRSIHDEGKSSERARVMDDYENYDDAYDDDPYDPYGRHAYSGQLFDHEYDDYMNSMESSDEYRQHMMSVFDTQDFYGDEDLPPPYRRGRTARNLHESPTEIGDRRTGRSTKSVKSKDQDRYGVLMVVPWKQQRSRHKRHADNAEDTTESNQSIEVQSMEQEESEPFPPGLPIVGSNQIDSFEQSIFGQKLSDNYPVSKTFEKDAKLSSKNNGKNQLPTLIEDTIPRLQDVIVDGLEKARNLTGSVEHLIKDVNEDFNNEATENYNDEESTSTTQNIFHSVISNIQRFFACLQGVTRILNG